MLVVKSSGDLRRWEKLPQPIMAGESARSLMPGGILGLAQKTDKRGQMTACRPPLNRLELAQELACEP